VLGKEVEKEKIASWGPGKKSFTKIEVVFYQAGGRRDKKRRLLFRGGNTWN